MKSGQLLSLQRKIELDNIKSIYGYTEPQCVVANLHKYVSPKINEPTFVIRLWRKIQQLYFMYSCLIDKETRKLLLENSKCGEISQKNITYCYEYRTSQLLKLSQKKFQNYVNSYKKNKATLSNSDSCITEAKARVISKTQIDGY